GHVLSIENKFELNREILKDELNNLLLKENAIKDFNDISPERLFKGNFSRNKKGGHKGSGMTYKQIQDNIYTKFFDNNKINYKIITPDGKDFDNLSPGLKTSIILELILNFEEDRAPLIIDQPEDNLATSYINKGLVESIKKMKSKKQIIFVSHNATIPMAGDAQNVILCENINGKIKIRSNPLEGKINEINVVDHIAKIADGGKPSIKKRFKKYNLKKFNE
ncbi:MAG: ATPase, partial [Candidatus Zixiibacteriota bacterium]